MTPDVRTAGAGGTVTKPKKTAMLVAQRIVGEITDGRLEPGSHLLPEREMLAAYGVARGTLREALRFLEIQGVISIKTGVGGGPMVSSPDPRRLASLVALPLQMQQTRFRAILEARLVLEPVLAGKAAEHLTPGQLAELGESITRMAGVLGDEGAFLRENEVFHALIAQGAANPAFALFITSLNWITDASQLGVSYGLEARRSVWQEHIRIRDALAARDAAQAAVAMRRHIQDFATFLERHHGSVLDQPLRWDQVDR